MFSIGEYVVYGTNGICEVKDITRLDLTGANKERDYYVLEPVRARGNHSFVPVDSDKVLLRKVIQKTEAEALIDEIPMIDGLERLDDKNRELRYKEMVKECQCRSWICIIKTIYDRRLERFSQGKKMTATDERYMKLAQENLYEELGFALDIDRSQVETYVSGKIKDSHRDE